MNSKTHLTNSFEETYQLGESFSKKIGEGDTILLYGDLGTGKTTFVKGVLNAFNYKYDVTSLTLSLINEYEAIKKVIHIDCYREKNVKRWINLGIIDYFNDSSIVIIEWPEVLKDILPDNTIKIQFKHLEVNKREIKFI
tara:strand:+ start:162 stop:578 length:417 start_codon:yes stop_codon:yes gene_type:complete